MSAIAQRRVAGATALMILLYLLQVALFAPGAGAQAAETCPDGVDGWEKVESNDPDPSGEFGSITWTNRNTDGPGEALEVVVNEGYEIEICIKQGNDPLVFQTFEFTTEDDIQTARDGDLSHFSWRLIDGTPDTPTFDVGPCDEEGVRTVSFTIPDGYEISLDDSDGVLLDFWIGPQEVQVDLEPGEYSWIFWELLNEQDKVAIDEGNLTVDPCEVTVSASGVCSNVDGVFAVISIVVSESGAATVTVLGPDGYNESGDTTGNLPNGPIGAYTWSAVASDGYVIDGGDSGGFTVEDCDNSTTTTTSTTTTLPPPPPPSTAVIFSAACDVDGNFVASFSLPNASGRLDIDGDGAFGPGEVGLDSGTYVLVGETYKWDATADPGFVMTGTASGSGAVPTCDSVLGTTITTVPEVSADTLPFTGSESGEMAKLALLALVAGALMLFAVRGPKEEEGAAAEIGGWSSL